MGVTGTAALAGDSSRKNIVSTVAAKQSHKGEVHAATAVQQKNAMAMDQTVPHRCKFSTVEERLKGQQEAAGIAFPDHIDYNPSCACGARRGS
mmetsp:Transcript_14797/g.22123  ORF Transcript_14797/g.22123 Transcript_14797/m.22123 type:complete len:93 (+) Transcript_14797:220-498(+)